MMNARAVCYLLLFFFLLLLLTMINRIKVIQASLPFAIVLYYEKIKYVP